MMPQYNTVQHLRTLVRDGGVHRNVREQPIGNCLLHVACSVVVLTRIISQVSFRLDRAALLVHVGRLSFSGGP